MNVLADDPNDHDRTAACAHQLWLREGCPEGRAMEHWNMAQELISRIDRESVLDGALERARRPRRPKPTSLTMT